jgi:ABC-type uncharacterized transport system permease subunit
MSSFVFSLIALCAYGLAAFVVTQRLYHVQGPRLKLLFSAATLGVVAHMLALSQSLFTAEGQNFSLMNVSSLVCWLITLAFTVTALRTPILLLLPIVYGFAALVQFLVLILPAGTLLHHFEQSPWLLLHILIAFISYVILIMATLYSFQVSYISHQLKQKNPIATGTVLPPLMQAEQLLFRLISLGTLLLGVTLLSGAVFSEQFFAVQHLHKNILSLLAFMGFVILIIGNRRAGWRGRIANTILIIASILLTLAYFGSRFVREVLLSS